MPKPIIIGVAMFAIFMLAINVRHYLHYASNHLYLQVLEKKVLANDCETAIQLLEHMDFRTALILRIYYPLTYGNCNPRAEILLQKMNQVIAYDPNNPIARIVRGKHYLESQQPQLAAEDFQVVVTILPHRAIGYVGLGNATAQQGKTTLAKKHFQQALQIEPDNETALEMLSRLGNQQQ